MNAILLLLLDNASMHSVQWLNTTYALCSALHHEWKILWGQFSGIINRKKKAQNEKLVERKNSSLYKNYVRSALCHV
jgi:hypothetical protein